MISICSPTKRDPPHLFSLAEPRGDDNGFRSTETGNKWIEGGRSGVYWSRAECKKGQISPKFSTQNEEFDVQGICP